MIALRILALFLIAFPVSANYGSALVSEVTSIYDADTFRANINGWPPIIGERAPIRVKGVDAPELRGKCESEKVRARLAKQFTVAKLRGAKTIRLDELERGKYFRILAVVSVDGENLGQALIDEGLARPYDGGKRQGWCD